MIWTLMLIRSFSSWTTEALLFYLAEIGSKNKLGELFFVENFCVEGFEKK